MKGSLERTRRVLALEKPDRPPLFDLLPNDAVLQYFNDGQPVAVGDDPSALRAIAAAVDGSRWSQYSPAEERITRLPDGRTEKTERWTVWTEEHRYGSSEAYRAAKQHELAERRRTAGQAVSTGQDEWYRKNRQVLAGLGDDFYFLLAAPSPGLMNVWHEVGLEEFSYYLYDCEDLIVEQLELNTDAACRWLEGLPEDDPFEAIFLGEDIAFKTGPMIRVQWLERHYFPRLARVIASAHARRMKVVFHSDGNLNAIMDGLVEAGADAINPVEVSAGMDLADLHRRYPKLVFAGGIDVSHLLPFGTPAQIREAVVRAIEDTQGQILVGSSTEVFNIVPLENFLAMREAAMGYRH